MAPPIGDDELKLKQRARRRLIGAIALLTALVFILPMLLDKEPRRSTNDIAVHIPAPQQTPTNPELAPQEPEAKPEVIPPPALEPSGAEAAAPEPAPPLVEQPAKPLANHGFFVQVGVFSKAENVKSVQAKLAKNGMTAIIESIKTSAGSRTRVRVGPFDNRNEADQALSKVRQFGEKNAEVVKVERAR